ncbi:MAG: DUF4202 domain-containing protein [Burkholderiales bacterium]|jgi:hypothetical protein|nr:hypothetical protein [Rhodocyclaceae bacterium]MCZ2418572.1 DUF4202 domain-containing protein [Burkholderiales bacterium]HNQ57744.1 DUF4202 domain-containing protein [Candidatus Desulfobacillus denitrificans]HNT63077.1 DUF4202 domain-containing protein [Candidatus Desulfobacillus denitrificans]
MIADKQRFDATIAAFDAANAEDPNRDEGQPKELLYARRMSAMLARFAPDAPEAVRLAARAQHLQRWKTPRTSYPADRQGYLQWRSGLYRFHAETAGRILRENGYDAETTERVQAAVGKKALKLNADTQLLEDTADLVFLEHYLAGFMARHADYSEGKWLDILRKTWQKMSPGAREFVLAGKVSLPETAQPLIRKAAG